MPGLDEERTLALLARSCIPTDGIYMPLHEVNANLPRTASPDATFTISRDGMLQVRALAIGRR